MAKRLPTRRLPMRFYVMKPSTETFTNTFKSSYLIEDEVINFFGSDRHVAAAKPLQVGISRMRTDGDLLLDRRLNGMPDR